MHAIDTYHPFTSHMHAHYLHMYTLHVHAHTIHMYMYTLHMHTAHTSHLPPTHSTRIRHICILYILHCTHTYHTCIHTYQLYHTALSHQPMHTPHITYYIHMHTDYTYLLRPHIHIQPLKLSVAGSPSVFLHHCSLAVDFSPPDYCTSHFTFSVFHLQCIRLLGPEGAVCFFC